MKEMKIFNVSVTGFEESLLASGYPMSKNDVYQYGSDIASKTLFYSPYNKTIYETHTWNKPVIAVKSVSKIVSSLANAKPGSGHDCFLKGITVAFDISYPVYWSPQFQRYHFADIVSSTSAMHRLTKFDINENMQHRVDPRTIEIIKEMIECYNMAIEQKESRGYQLKTLQCRYYNLPEKGSRWVVYLDDISTGVEVISTKDKECVDWNNIDLSTYELAYRLDNMYQAIIATCPQGLMKTMRVVTNALQLKSMIAQRSNHKLEEWRMFTKWAKSLYFWRYLNMYQDDLDIHKEDMELLGKMEYLLYHLMENHRHLIYDKDSPYELTHEIVGNNNGDCSLTRLVDKDDVGSISTYDAIKDIIDGYSLSLHSTIGQLAVIFSTLFLIFDKGELLNENRDLKDKVKTLENYILQHAHGKISTKELCDKINK